MDMAKKDRDGSPRVPPGGGSGGSGSGSGGREAGGGRLVPRAAAEGGGSSLKGGALVQRAATFANMARADGGSAATELRMPDRWAAASLSVDLSGWALGALPGEVAGLARLRRLYLSFNQFESIPPEVCTLTTLEELDMSNNRLTQLPRELWRLAGLRRLRLAFNAIRYVPPGMQKLTNLRVLNLYSNELDYLPLELRDMTALSELYLGANKLNPATCPEAADLKGVAGRLRLLPTLANFTRKIDCGFSASVAKMVVVDATTPTVWAGCSDGTIQVWRVNGEHLKGFKAHERRIYTLATDGTHVFSAAEDKFVSVWEPKDLSLVCSVKCDDALPVTSIFFYDDKVLLGTVGADIHVGRVRRSKKEFALEGKHQVSGATVIATMARVRDAIWVGSERQILVVLPGQGFKVEAAWRAHERGITDLLATGSGASVWSCSQDATIRIWDSKSKQLVHTISQHQSPVTCMLAVKHTVWSGSWDKSICIWNSEEPYDLLQELKGRHKDAVANLVEVHRGKEVWSGSTSLDNCIYIWRLSA